LTLKNTIVFFLIVLGLHCYAQDNRVADLKIEGNKKIKSSFINKLVKINEGAVLDSTLIEADIKRLKRLPSVSNANYEVLFSGNNAYTVIYQIEENFTTIPFVNVYTTNNDEFAYRIGVYEYNFLGRNISLGGFYQNDIYSSYGINFRAPYLFSRRIGMAINHQNLTTEEPVFFTNSTADYKYNNKSYEILGLYKINAMNRFELGFNYFAEGYNYKSGTTSPSVPQNLNVKKVLYKSIYEFNNLDYEHHYVAGFKSTFNFQFVTSTSDELPEFGIGRNDFSCFVRVAEKGNWASRLRVGFSSNAESPFAPFAVDNNLNLRGVGNTIDRGTGVLVLNTEYRHTLIEKKWFVLQSNTFIDAGSWRNPGGDFGDFGKSENLRIYPGFGLRFIHKWIYNATFRIDYGMGVTENATQGLVFGIGQYF